MRLARDELERLLSPTEVARLDELLSKLEEPASYQHARGVSVAVASAPTPIPPSGWLPLVLGPGASDESMETVEELLSLVLRDYNQTSRALERGEYASVCPEPDDVAGIVQWCSGYVEAAELDDEWVDDDTSHQVLMCMDVLAGNLPVEELRDENDEHFLDAERWLQHQRNHLSDFVELVYEYWQAERRPGEAVERDEPVEYAEPEVGRNDPCPCGSGKKYKNCCMN